MENLVQDLRLLAANDGKNKVNALKWLEVIQRELSIALYFINGKSEGLSKITIHKEERFVFIYDAPDNLAFEGFAFETGSAFDRHYTKLEDIKGQLFWSALKVAIEWIPTVVKEVQSKEDQKQKMIGQLELLASSLSKKEPVE